MNETQLIKAPSLWTGDELAVREDLYVDFEKSHIGLADSDVFTYFRILQ